MSTFAEVLMASVRRLEQATDFGNLLTCVEELAEGVHGAGELVAYDVADRIGLRRDLAPQWVYLHAGTAAGAHCLGLGTPLRLCFEVCLQIELCS